MPTLLPELDGGEDLIALAQGVGWCGQGGMGPVPLSALELTAWCDGTGEQLTQWEFATLLKLSRAYVAGVHAKEAPWQPVIVKMALASAAFSARPLPVEKTAARKPSAARAR